MKLASLLVTVLSSTVILGCAGQRGASNDGAQTGGPTLEGTRWVLLDIGGTPAEVAETVNDAPYLLLGRHDDGVSGSTGVNFLSGQYERDGDELKFGPLITTRRAGPPAMMQQEIAFTRALDQTAGWRIREGALELLDADGNALARFRASALGTP